MVRFGPVTVTFRFEGRDFIVSGWASIRDVFVNRVETPMIYAQLGDPNLDFQPLLVEETGEIEGVEAPNDGQEEEPHDEPWEGQEHEDSRDEVRSERASDNNANSASGMPPSLEHRRRRRSRNGGEEDEDDVGLV